MPSVLLLLLLGSLAAAAPHHETDDRDYVIELDGRNMRDEVIMPQKRAALVLDRLLVALQKALHEGPGAPRTEVDLDGPRTAPLRYATDTDDMTGLQRRGNGMARGRVLRCYFNAITCF